ncbi:MAG: PD40 domain-containing protein [Acidobacteriia bacterium]|nr:PD40 domain-containing protein [Terriglobia bacterium]
MGSNQQQRFTFSAERESEPAWSPDGKQIAFMSTNGIVVKPADGSRKVQTIVSGKAGEFRMPRWSPRGDLLVFQRSARAGFEIWYIPLQPNQKPIPFLTTPGMMQFPSISPDGRYLAYTSDETQTQETFVRSFPAGEGKWMVSSKTGQRPRWSPKGDELYFLEGNSMMAARVHLQPSFSVLGVEKLFDGASQRLRLQVGYSVMLGGMGFVTSEYQDKLEGPVASSSWKTGGGVPEKAMIVKRMGRSRNPVHDRGVWGLNHHL